MLDNSQIHWYSPTHIFSPTPVWLPDFFKNHFFSRHPWPIPLGKNTLTAVTISSHSSFDSTDRSMSSHSSSESIDTSMTSDSSSDSTHRSLSSESSSVTSKASLKQITHLLSEIFLNILIQVCKVVDWLCQYMDRFSL